MVSLSDWRIDNDQARLDSEFQSLTFRQAIERVREGPALQLREGGLEIIHPHELKREYAEEDGVWFVRTQNLRPMRIDRTNRVCLPDAVALKLPRNRIYKNDILITRTGANRGDCAMFDSDEMAYGSSHTFILRSDGWGHSYLTTFLNCRYGREQIDKGAYGAAQPELAPYYLQRIWVPSASDSLQSAIEQALTTARAMSDASAVALAEAEALLLDALGLRGWSPPEPLTSTRSAAAVAKAGRLDSQYYMPAKRDMLDALARLTGAPLAESFQSVRELVDPNKGSPATIVRNYDLTDALQPVLDPTTAPTTFSEIDSQKKRLRDGDLAVSRLRSYLKEIAVVRVADAIPAIGSSEFFVLRARASSVALSAAALMVYLKSPPVQTILKWCQDGSQHPRFSERDLLAIPLPDVVIELNEILTAMVGIALDQRGRSLALLEAAKRAVEIAIEDGEAAALAFIAAALSRKNGCLLLASRYRPRLRRGPAANGDTDA